MTDFKNVAFLENDWWCRKTFATADLKDTHVGLQFDDAEALIIWIQFRTHFELFFRLLYEHFTLETVHLTHSKSIDASEARDDDHRRRFELRAIFHALSASECERCEWQGRITRSSHMVCCCLLSTIYFSPYLPTREERSCLFCNPPNLKPTLE